MKTIVIFMRVLCLRKTKCAWYLGGMFRIISLNVSLILLPYTDFSALFNISLHVETPGTVIV